MDGKFGELGYFACISALKIIFFFKLKWNELEEKHFQKNFLPLAVEAELKQPLF